MPDDLLLSDAVVTWVNLTATELYADFCNSGHGHEVLATALRAGYARGRVDEYERWAPAPDLEASVRAAAQATPAGTVRMPHAKG